MKNREWITRISKIAVLSALAGILNLFTVPLPFFPSFYQMDVSDVVVLIGGFHLGPWSVVVMEGIKQLVNISINGTDTAFVGELANFFAGVALTFPAAFLYKRKKSFRRALLGMGTGLLSTVAVAAVLNYFVLIPLYAKAFGFEAVLNMASSVIPAISDLKTLILYATIPFNILKGFVCVLLTTFLYKRVSPLLKKW